MLPPDFHANYRLRKSWRRCKKQRKSTCVCLALTKKKSHPQSRWLPRLLVSFQQAAYFNESGLMEVPNSYRSKLAEEWGFEPQRSVTRL